MTPKERYDSVIGFDANKFFIPTPPPWHKKLLNRYINQFIDGEYVFIEYLEEHINHIIQPKETVFERKYDINYTLSEHGELFLKVLQDIKSKNPEHFI